MNRRHQPLKSEDDLEIDAITLTDDHLIFIPISSIVNVNVNEDPDIRLELASQNTEEKDDADREVDTYDSCCAYASPFLPILYLGPVAVAITEAADISLSLWTSKTTSLVIIITASSAAFFSSIGLTGESTRDNFKASCDILKHRALPANWAVLRRTQERLAIVISILPATLAPILETMQAYYFVNGLPTDYNFSTKVNPILWSTLSGTISGFAGLTVVLTQSAEMYKIIRERLAGERTPYTNTCSQFISPVLGGSLGLLDALQKTIQSYIAIKTIFNVQTLTGRVCVGIPSMLNAIPFFCFSGMYSINAMDAFFGEKKPFKPKKIIAMTLSISLAVYLAFLRRALNKSFYHDVTIDFGLDPKKIPWEVFESLSWLMFGQEVIQTTATLYSPMYNLIDGVTNKVTKASRYLYDLCSSPTDDPEDTQHLLVEEDATVILPDEIQDETAALHPQEQAIEKPEIILVEPRVSSHPDTLFSSAKNLPIEKEKTIPQEDCSKTSNGCVMM